MTPGAVLMRAGACAVGLLAALAVVAEGSPRDWLDRMANAIQTTNYEGTIIRVADGTAEALKVIHTVADGVVREKLIAQEGDGLEIIRKGNEVHSILPNRQSVLVEEWGEQSTLFSTLPSTNIRLGTAYDVLLVGEGRVAGRPAVQLSIKPHDGFRYEHRLWLDVRTAFPLQTEVVGDNGVALEQVKFVDIEVSPELTSSALASSYSTENFKWYTPPERHILPGEDGGWSSDSLPRDFSLVSQQLEELPGGSTAVTHILYSDGLANVSVFIAAHDGEEFVRRSRVGASNTYTTVVGSHRVTAMGEVPAVTVEQIATSMRLE
jgi:sigma-E factor negative regulatory protein RseB